MEIKSYLGSAMISALVFWAFVPSDAAAQSSDADLPLCVTSTGQDGRLFKDFYGYVAVPRAFDRAASTSPKVQGVADVTTPLGPLVIPRALGPVVLQFFERETLVYQCAADVVPFDPDQHGLDAITEGRCDLEYDQDMPMLTGIARHTVLPQDFIEFAVGDPYIADFQPITSGTLYLEGNHPGVTVLLLVKKGGSVYGQCPIVVEDAAEYFARQGIDEG